VVPNLITFRELWVTWNSSCSAWLTQQLFKRYTLEAPWLSGATRAR
jgi:hypothetical protein